MSGDVKDAKTSTDYSEEMKNKMGSTLTYKHEDGMNYNKAFDRIIVGSCVQTAADVDTLKKDGIGIIFSLQEDKDMAHFSLDLAPIVKRAEEVGIAHVRNPIRDFDPLSLRRHLPDAVKRLSAEMAARPKELAYIHCTAGLGRAPGVALSYMFMVEGWCLDEAYAKLFAVRRCHPQLGMIRAAACDMLAGGLGTGKVRIAIARPKASIVEIAGLDVGWHKRLPLAKDAASEEFVVEHTLPPGTYQYKFVVDGEWMPSMELPTVDDNGNVNNVITVTPEPGSPDAARRERIMAERGRPTAEELAQLRASLGVVACSSPGGYQSG